MQTENNTYNQWRNTNDNISVHHIGSTSVEFLKAKPVIDISVEIESFENIEKYINGLEQIGYVNMGKDILPGRYYFINGEPRTHQIHLFEKDNSLLKEQIVLRNILRENEKVRSDYEKLKLQLADVHKNDKHLYTDKKTEFIRSILNKYQDEI